MSGSRKENLERINPHPDGIQHFVHQVKTGLSERFGRSRKHKPGKLREIKYVAIQPGDKKAMDENPDTRRIK